MQWLIDLIYDKCREQGFAVHRGDPADFDFSMGDLTLDGSWYTLDFSSIVPEHAHAIIIRLDIRATLALKNFWFRHPDNSDIYSLSGLATQFPATPNRDTVIAFCNSSRELSYMGSSATWTLLNITVLGWLF